MTLFGRIASAEVETVLRELLEATARPDYRAIARNLIHDQRVATPREAALRELLPQPLTRQELEIALRSYHEQRVQRSDSPDFVDDQLNGPNILAGSSLGEHRISKDLPLGRVLNLSRLDDFYRKMHEKEIAGFDSVPDSAPTGIRSWVDYQMDESLREGFIKNVLEHLWPNPVAGPYEPAWATTWDALDSVANDDSSRWAEVVGVRADRGDWLILLRYPARKAGTLVRPTQLDAGWNCYHFPSPPTTPLASGGHPMDLGGENCNAALHSEFIHMQIQHNIDHWKDAGCRAAQARQPIERDFATQRKRHWTLLQARDGARIRDWMPAPI